MYESTNSPIQAGEPFSSAETEHLVNRLHTDGFCHLDSVLEPDEVGALREAMERKVLRMISNS